MTRSTTLKQSSTPHQGKESEINEMILNLDVYHTNIPFSDKNQDGNTWYWTSGAAMSSYTNFNGQTPANRPGTNDCFNIFTGKVNSYYKLSLRWP